WKVLIPGALVWTLMIATIRVWRRQGGSAGIYIIAGLILAALMLLAWAWDVTEANRAKRAAEIEAAEADADARAFPVPPLDLPHYHGVGLVQESVSATTADRAVLARAGDPPEPRARKGVNGA